MGGVIPPHESLGEIMENRTRGHSAPPLFPSTEAWQRSYHRTTGTLERLTTRLDAQTLRNRPASIGPGNVAYLLGEIPMGRLAKAVMTLSSAMYNLHTLAGYHRTNPDDLPDLEHARRHLRAASESLSRIQRRHGGQR